MSAEDLTIRRATAADLDAIIDVASAALGWAPGEPHHELFRWKHLDNPFGASPMWVAVDGERIAGFRAFMRWELERADGSIWRAVRAVDTATHPDYQRRGIFKTLTMQAVDEMIDERVDIVFNTPNDQSRPGYLKLDWIDVGRLPVTARPLGVGSLARMAKARVAADKWSQESELGESAVIALAQSSLDDLLASQPRPKALATALSAPFLRWRYELGPMHYRCWAPDGVDAGMVLFRLRARGAATECTVTHVLAPDGSAKRRRALLRGLAGAVDADYMLAIGAPDPLAGFMPFPRQGPRLTARTLTSEPPNDIGSWSMQLGDIELF